MPGGQPVVVISTKNVGLAMLLAAFCGPLGMLYATIPGAFVMMIINPVLIIMTIAVFDGSVWFLPLLLTWPVSMFWAGAAARSYNRRLVAAPQL